MPMILSKKFHCLSVGEIFFVNSKMVPEEKAERDPSNICIVKRISIGKYHF
jgi:hypothetical protein